MSNILFCRQLIDGSFFDRSKLENTPGSFLCMQLAELINLRGEKEREKKEKKKKREGRREGRRRRRRNQLQYNVRLLVLPLLQPPLVV